MEDQREIASDAVLCGDCVIQGNVKIGSKTIIHPKVTIIAEDGPIVIGDNNIIEELTTIINKNGKSSNEDKTLYIGSNNVFQVGCYSAASRIGDNNILESKIHIDRGVEIYNHCVIGALCSVTGPIVLKDKTVIFGQGAKKRFHDTLIQPQTRQIDLLTKLLPKYHLTSLRNATE